MVLEKFEAHLQSIQSVVIIYGYHCRISTAGSRLSSLASLCQTPL